MDTMNLTGMARYEARLSIQTEGAQYHLRFVERNGLNCACKVCRTAQAVME